MSIKQQTPKYNSFDEFFVYEVQEYQRKNPDHVKLNGMLKGGSRKPFAYFNHRGNWWKVDEDTSIDKLHIAYQVLLKGEDPFIIKDTSSKKSKCLTISGQPLKPKNFYVYLIDLAGQV